ncbi:MAG: sugar phosphate nucleotidyltransferase [Candidatus Giovannonibacteria bacterium]|nr:sugar phosphate nucleotidyltransferase [Candidatus Giovannonibacteria bacterium]
MKIVILAAGEGVRMRPLTLSVPKPLLRFGGQASLDHFFEALPDEITEAIIVVGYLAEQIKTYCGNNFHGRTINYIDGSSKGNAASFINTKHLFASQERFAVSYGDELITKQEIENCLKSKYSWLCYELNNPKNAGVALVNSAGRILEVIEKPAIPPSNLAANGFMVANSDIFSYKPDLHVSGEYYFSSMMNKFCLDHRVQAIVGHEDHWQLTIPADLDRLDKLFTNKNKL